MKKHIPNGITLLNLLSGSIAILFAVNDNLEYAAYFVFLGIVFDFFDGFAARILNVKSDLGLQLDSLADMVTAGLVPGIVMFQLLQWSTGNVVPEITRVEHPGLTDLNLWPVAGLLITLASAYRLAKFNIDTRQTSSFIGLPTPANTLLIISFPLILQFQPNEALQAVILNKWFLLVITLISCYLLNAEIPLFALKFKTWGFRTNAIRYIFLFLALILIVSMHYLAIPFIIAMYIVLSVIANRIKW